MAKLTRVFQNLFGLNGNQSHFGQFGSRAINAPFNTKDPASIQALSAFITNGWLDAINAANKAPFLEDWNGLIYLIFYQLCYGFQEGIPEWNSGTTYFVGGIVKKSGTSELYASVVDNNLNNALPNQVDNGFWHFVNPTNTVVGEVKTYAGAVTPVGYLDCDGTDYAQTAFPSLFAAIGNAWDTFNGHVSPGAGRFRVPDMRGITPIGAGQGLGLSLRTLGQFIGEETHTLVIGEMPVHNHPVSWTGGAQVGTGTGTIAGAVPGNFLPVGPVGLNINVGNQGGGGAHNNMQPSGVFKFIIKA